MNHPSNTTRRTFLRTTLAGAAGIGVATLMPRTTLGQESSEKPLGLKKAVGWGMIKAGNTVEEKFALAKQAGFDGVEMNAPDAGVDVAEAVKAAAKTGIVVHGVVDSVHWKDRFSDPSEEVRARGMKGFEQALHDAKTYGASTVLLVPGRVTKGDTETFDLCWQRSQAEIRKALPLIEQLGVKVGIEDVWNDFITKPEQMVKYVDEIGSPMVGSYFDIGNITKFDVPAAEWIRQLNKRILKLHIKGYSHEKKWVKIGDGDEDWAAIRKALGEIGYHGWATAEVAGGDLDVLKDVKERMDRALGA